METAIPVATKPTKASFVGFEGSRVGRFDKSWQIALAPG